MTDMQGQPGDDSAVSDAPSSVRLFATPAGIALGSIEAIAAMTSAIMPPSLIAAVACRLTKLGSRTWTRHGRVLPSLTTW